MQGNELIPHLFRNEYSKIVAVLSKRFGFREIEIAEDIASDTFLTAARTWGIDGIPSNPVAWIYTVAKNKAKNYLRRQVIYQQKVVPELQKDQAAEEETDLDLSPGNILDSQLQMMFTICHPLISPEAQIGLSLRILCGFSIDEIAHAFLSSRETINKRLYRAREKLRETGISIEFPSTKDFEPRLEIVLRTIYLLYSEGYYSSTHDEKIRKDLCYEAMRLCNLLLEYPPGQQPQVYALQALICFHSSRLDARKTISGEIIFYQEQDTALWKNELIEKGIELLKRSAVGNHLTKYHLEAGIAYWSTQKEDTREKWDQVLTLYDQLLKIEYSPIAALNRAFVLSKTGKRDQAIRDAKALNLQDNHLYYGLLGELYSPIDRPAAIENYKKAISLAKTNDDIIRLQQQIEMLDNVLMC